MSRITPRSAALLFGLRRIGLAALPWTRTCTSGGLGRLSIVSIPAWPDLSDDADHNPRANGRPVLTGLHQSLAQLRRLDLQASRSTAS